MTTRDDSELRVLFDRVCQAWTDGDATAYGACFTADADYVGYDGSHAPGRVALVEQHDRLFRGVLTRSALVGEVASIRYVRPDVAVLHATGAVRMPWRSAVPKRRRSYQTMIALRESDGWRLTAFHNSRYRPLRIPGPNALSSRMSRAMSQMVATLRGSREAP